MSVRQQTGDEHLLVRQQTGDEHLLTAYRLEDAANQILRSVGDALLADDTAEFEFEPGWLPADPLQLRGIPVVGCVRVGGAIRHSSPHLSVR